MLPVITVGGLQLSTYWIAMALGFVAMVLLMLKRKEHFALNRWQAIAFTAVLMASGLFGCKLLYVLESFPDVVKNGISWGGFSFFGAVFLIPFTMGVFGKALSLTPRQSLDASAPCVALMVGVIRFGCFLNGCCGGRTIEIHNRAFRWPTQAMEGIGDIVILLLLLSREEDQKTEGSLYPMFLIWYGLLRFMIEFLRSTPKDWLCLSHGQWFSVIAVAIGFFSLRRDRYAKS